MIPEPSDAREAVASVPAFSLTVHGHIRLTRLVDLKNATISSFDAFDSLPVLIGCYVFILFSFLSRNQLFNAFNHNYVEGCQKYKFIFYAVTDTTEKPTK